MFNDLDPTVTYLLSFALTMFIASGFETRGGKRSDALIIAGCLSLVLGGVVFLNWQAILVGLVIAPTVGFARELWKYLKSGSHSPL